MKKAIKNIGDFDNIIAIRGCKSPGYCELVCKDTTLIIGGSIAKVSQLLDNRFLRINRSYLVNKKYIVSTASDGTVLIENGIEICIPRRKRS